MRPFGPVRSVSEEEFSRDWRRRPLLTSPGDSHFRIDSTGSAKPSLGFALSDLVPNALYRSTSRMTHARESISRRRLCHTCSTCKPKEVMVVSYPVS
jgi:hypothetical protein